LTVLLQAFCLTAGLWQAEYCCTSDFLLLLLLLLRNWVVKLPAAGLCCAEIRSLRC
jgi:hypothetical protein